MAREKGDSGKPRSAVGRDTNIAQSIGSGAIRGDVNIATLGSLTVVNPFVGPVNTLPPDVKNFVGRQVESERLVSLLRRGEPNVIVISGMGGSGKSALSLHVAHRVADSYPDGLIWASLTQQGDEVRAPGNILDLLLRCLGIPPDHIPPDLEARSALYRSLLHQRRILIVLDDATSAQQVRPLLPPTSSSVVIITSRSRLVPFYDASHIDLDVLTPLESVDLLQHFIGQRPESDRKALQKIAELCGHLPLAIAIAGAYLRLRPHISVANFAAELADRSRHLDKLDIGDFSVRAAFDLSYRQLDQALAKAFRLLSWFPGPAIDTAAAAALLDTSIQLAQRWLDQLVDRHLIDLQSHRYRYHDLLRAYAREASKADFPDDRAAALVRLRNWYLDRAQHAVTALIAATVDRSGAVTRNEALAWLEDERTNVLSLAAETVTSQQATYVWELSDTLYPFYDLRGHWTDCQAIHELALQVARSAQNQTAAGRILNNLGVAYREQHQYTACISCLEESITLSRSTGSRETTALALMNLGVAHHGIGQLLEAATCLESALSLSVFHPDSARSGLSVTG